MQTIAGILGGDMRATIEEAQRPKRKYEHKTTPNIKKPLRARFKCGLEFTNGKKRYFHSLDLVKHPKTGKYHIDEFDGLNWLFDMIRDNIKNIKFGGIYAHIDSTPLTKNKRYNLPVVTVGPKWITYHAEWKAVQQDEETYLEVIPLIETRRIPRLSL